MAESHLALASKRILQCDLAPVSRGTCVLAAAAEQSRVRPDRPTTLSPSHGQWSWRGPTVAQSTATT
jgi:hypothetical protein